MLSKASEVFANSLALNIEPNAAYGIYSGYFITFYENKRHKCVDISCHVCEDEDDSILSLEISDTIKRDIEKFNIEDYDISSERIHIVSSAEISVFRNMLDTIIETLSENGLAGADSCSICNRSFSSKEKKKVVTKGDTKLLVCQSCALELLEESENAAPSSTPEAKPSALKLAAGALLGSLLAAVIYSLLFLIPVSDDAGILKYFVCLAGILIGLFSVYGARIIAKCGYNKPLAVISTACALLFSVLAHYSGCVVSLINKFSFTAFKFTPASFFKLVFSQSANLRYFLAGTVITMCAVGVALIFVLTSLMKKKGENKNVKVSVVTLNK